MSSSDLAISVRDLSKSYTIRHQEEQHITLAEQLLHRARHPFSRQERETFWALRNVNFDVRKGEVLGVIGRNGAGKSTLLKLLSRITPPTTGEVRLYGRIGSLLEVGTGFHPELTGRENVFLNGAILGMRTREIERRFDEIVAFARVEKFLDTPVKRFSSGMYVRLAFAVAAHLDTEILLVDEVLAVGDTEFQRKCLGKIGEVAATGRAVLFVSHQMASISSLCSRAIVLNAGGLEVDGPVEASIRTYTTSFKSAIAPPTRRAGVGELRVVAASVAADPVQATEEKRITFTIERFQDFEVPFFVCANVIDERERIVAQCDSRLVGLWLEPTSFQTAVLRLRQPWLLPGEYRVDIFLFCHGLMDTLEGAARFTVAPDLPYRGGAIDGALAQSIVLPDFDYEIESTSSIGSPAVDEVEQSLGL